MCLLLHFCQTPACLPACRTSPALACCPFSPLAPSSPVTCPWQVGQPRPDSRDGQQGRGQEGGQGIEGRGCLLRALGVARRQGRQGRGWSSPGALQWFVLLPVVSGQFEFDLGRTRESGGRQDPTDRWSMLNSPTAACPGDQVGRLPCRLPCLPPVLPALPCPVLPSSACPHASPAVLPCLASAPLSPPRPSAPAILPTDARGRDGSLNVMLAPAPPVPGDPDGT